MPSLPACRMGWNRIRCSIQPTCEAIPCTYEVGNVVKPYVMMPILVDGQSYGGYRRLSTSTALIDYPVVHLCPQGYVCVPRVSHRIRQSDRVDVPREFCGILGLVEFAVELVYEYPVEGVSWLRRMLRCSPRGQRWGRLFVSV